jgi:DNA modification methylase
MRYRIHRRKPGEIRDAIVESLSAIGRPASVGEIERSVNSILGSTKRSSVRSYLRLNAGGLFVREGRGMYALANGTPRPPVAKDFSSVLRHGKSLLVHADCVEWMREQPDASIHAVVTDPPYGLHEYSSEQQVKLREGKGGVWRVPPSFDGCVRSPLPRFTVLTREQVRELDEFFFKWATVLIRILVPGANVVVASNPLLSYVVSGALARAGLERRGELIRLVMTMRGGDRPKHAHQEFSDVSVMPRSMWEPWLLFRKPLEGRAQDNLRKWGTGGFRRPSRERPFGDVIKSSPTTPAERRLAPHPSLKPQAFMRQVVRGVLPLGKGIVLDPFAGSGSTLAAAEYCGYASIGIEKDESFFTVAGGAIPKLARFRVSDTQLELVDPISA